MSLPKFDTIHMMDTLFRYTIYIIDNCNDFPVPMDLGAAYQMINAQHGVRLKELLSSPLATQPTPHAHWHKYWERLPLICSTAIYRCLKTQAQAPERLATLRSTTRPTGSFLVVVCCLRLHSWDSVDPNTTGN